MIQAQIAIPLYLGPPHEPDTPAKPIYLATVSLMLYEKPDDAWCEDIRHRVINGILKSKWSVTLETLHGYKPPEDTRVPLKAVLALRRAIGELVAAEIQPDELVLVLSWFLYSSVQIFWRSIHQPATYS